MSDGVTLDSPAPRLERPLQGRMLTGVCAGVARHFGIDVTLVRVVAVIATFVGGAGVFVYVAATLLVPEEGQGQSLLRGGRRRSRAQLVIGAALVAIGAANVLGDFGIGHRGSAIWGSVQLAIGAILLLAIQDGRPGILRPGDAAADAAPASAGSGEAVTSPLPATTLPRRRSRGATAATLGAVLLASTAAIALTTAIAGDASWETVAGVGTIAAGLALVGGSALGAGPVAVIPVLLATAGALAVQAADLDLHGGIGTRSYRPAATADVRDDYRLGIGDLAIDLRDTTLPRGRTVIRAKVGIGALSVRAPRDATVRVVGHAGAGELSLLGREHDGTDVDGGATLAGPSTRAVVIDASVGFGAIRVVGPDGAMPDHDHDWSSR